MIGDRDPQPPKLVPPRTHADVEQDRLTDWLTTFVLVAMMLWFGLPTLLGILAEGF